jgi:hypothetical protein
MVLANPTHNVYEMAGTMHRWHTHTEYSVMTGPPSSLGTYL